jgi:hypothetical protein
MEKTSSTKNEIALEELRLISKSITNSDSKIRNAKNLDWHCGTEADLKAILYTSLYRGLLFPLSYFTTKLGGDTKDLGFTLNDIKGIPKFHFIRVLNSLQMYLRIGTDKLTEEFNNNSKTITEQELADTLFTPLETFFPAIVTNVDMWKNDYFWELFYEFLRSKLANAVELFKIPYHQILTLFLLDLHAAAMDINSTNVSAFYANYYGEKIDFNNTSSEFSTALKEEINSYNKTLQDLLDQCLKYVKSEKGKQLKKEGNDTEIDPITTSSNPDPYSELSLDELVASINSLDESIDKGKKRGGKIKKTSDKGKTALLDTLKKEVLSLEKQLKKEQIIFEEQQQIEIDLENLPARLSSLKKALEIKDTQSSSNLEEIASLTTYKSVLEAEYNSQNNSNETVNLNKAATTLDKILASKKKVLDRNITHLKEAKKEFEIQKKKMGNYSKNRIAWLVLIDDHLKRIENKR